MEEVLLTYQQVRRVGDGVPNPDSQGTAKQNHYLVRVEVTFDRRRQPDGQSDACLNCNKYMMYFHGYFNAA